MTAFSAIRQALETEFNTEWSTTDKVFDNTIYEPTKGTPWVRLTIMDGDSENISLSSASTVRKRYDGTIYTSIFVPSGTGTGTARTHADSIAAIWDNTTISGVKTLLSEIDRGPMESEWFSLIVKTPFYYDVTS